LSFDGSGTNPARERSNLLQFDAGTLLGEGLGVGASPLPTALFRTVGAAAPARGKTLRVERHASLWRSIS